MSESMVYYRTSEIYPTVTALAAMTNASPPSPLYLNLLAETAQIEWSELQRFFARGVLLKVARDLDLVSVAESVATDDTDQVAAWLSAGLLERVQAETAQDFAARNPELWAARAVDQ
jgi:hypothetical protein